MSQPSLRSEVTKALRHSILRRPAQCSKCSKPCVPRAHHDDYDKPLEVRWLCCSCHRLAHRGPHQPRDPNSLWSSPEHARFQPKVTVRTARMIRIGTAVRACTQGEFLDWALGRLAELAPGEIEAGS